MRYVREARPSGTGGRGGYDGTRWLAPNLISPVRVRKTSDSVTLAIGHLVLVWLFVGPRRLGCLLADMKKHTVAVLAFTRPGSDDDPSRAVY